MRSALRARGRAIVASALVAIVLACRQATPPAAPAGGPERISAQHLLIAWVGATKAPPSVTRGKAEARELVDALRRRALSGEDFAALAREYSDVRGARTGRQWGSFDRTALIPPLSEAAFALQPGELSPVVETDRGFHLIFRVRDGDGGAP